MKWVPVNYLYCLGLKLVCFAWRQAAGLQRMLCTLADTMLQLSSFCSEPLEFRFFFILLSLSKSTELKSRKQEVHEDVGIDTETAGSLLPLAIYLEEMGRNDAFSDNPANK